MIKKTKFLGALLIAACAFVLCSCGSSSNSSEKQNIVNNNDNINDKAEEKQKYVIELNLNNYLKYIDKRFIPIGSGSTGYITYYFQGSLSYAYYDNVVITSHFRSNKTGYEETDNEISLSTGGYAVWYSSGANGLYSITAVSGKVIYWI